MSKKRDIADDNARQNEYWDKVGGHPPPGYQDYDEDEEGPHPAAQEESWFAPQDPRNERLMRGRK